MTILITIIAIIFIVLGLILAYNWVISMMWASELGATLSDWLIGLIPLAWLTVGIGLLIWWF